jgi:hypothetical protein
MGAKSQRRKASGAKKMTGAKVTRIRVETSYLRQVLSWLQTFWTD